MIANRRITDIATEWQGDLDASIETGEAPAFDLGAGATILGGIPGILAMEMLDGARRDSARPVAAGGGAGLLWLSGLVHRRPSDMPPKSPAIVTAYTGPDPATHLAAMTTLDLRRSSFRRRPANLPPAMQPPFAPVSHPGAATAWESLPFWEAELPADVHGDGWAAWTAVVVAVALILIALIA